MRETDLPHLRPMETAPRDGTVVWLFQHHRIPGTGLRDPSKRGLAFRGRVPSAGMEGNFVRIDVDPEDEDAVHWHGEPDSGLMGWCPVDEFETILAEAHQPPPSTVVGVPAPGHLGGPGAFRAYMVVGRLGLAHTLNYLFLSGDNALARAEAMVRSQPHAFPGDAVVVDLGESYDSRDAADRRAEEMRFHLPRACGFYIGDPGPQ